MRTSAWLYTCTGCGDLATIELLFDADVTLPEGWIKLRTDDHYCPRCLSEAAGKGALVIILRNAAGPTLTEALKKLEPPPRVVPIEPFSHRDWSGRV